MSKLVQMANESLKQSLKEHLAWWGLQHFTSDHDYFAWQRREFSPADLTELHQLTQQKHAGDRRGEIAFYDLTAQPTIYPALYSQRYEYYEEIGRQVVAELGEAKEILDFGCGPGILTTFYAQRFPEKRFVGVDRSSVSIALAQQKANELGLRNIHFACLDIETAPFPGTYDLVVATHALLQAEQDSGLPSQSWQTFQRSHSTEQQAAFERRTGLAARLDRLCHVLSEHGCMIVFEKTRQLARRVPFQRALATRGFQSTKSPELICYRSIEEVVDDGPLYVLRKGSDEAVPWDESPEPDEGRVFIQRTVPVATLNPSAPLYENHWPSAQQAWERLHDRVVIKELTNQESDGRQVHVEYGRAEGYHYLYCANTFDQRQLVIVESPRAVLLEQYYQEIAGGLTTNGHQI